MTAPHEQPIAVPATVASHRIHDGWLTLRADTLRYAGGRERTAEVLEHPGGVTIVAFDREDRLLLVRQYRHPAAQPLLELPGVREALATTQAPRVAVSPIVGGAAVKGPAAEMLRSLGHEVSALGVARLYEGLLDCFVLDTADAALAPEVERLGMRAVVTATMMTDDARRAGLAEDVLHAVGLRT